MALSRRDIALLFATRSARLFGYGFLSVILVFYLTGIGLSEQATGLIFSLALLGDVGISLWITTSADRIGRRRMLLLSAMLIVFTGVIFLATANPLVIALAAIVGVISPSGNEIGPFLSIEQAALAQLVNGKQRTRVFAWYNLAGSFSTALGALASGAVVQILRQTGASDIDAYRAVLALYAGIGVVLAMLFTRLSPIIETDAPSPSIERRFGLHRSRGVVAKLSALFALDALGGGFVIQSIIAYWFYLRFGVEPVVLGSIFFAANLLAGISALLADRIAARIGLVNTMVFTHIPSNMLLMLVPLMPTLPLAIGVLLLRFSISQMDVPTRQSYTAAVVSPDERSAASGITSIARSIGALISPAISTSLIAVPMLASLPFFLAGGLKIMYDLLLFRSFRAMKPPEE